MVSDFVQQRAVLHDAPDDTTCPRCGWEAVPIESFIDTFTPQERGHQLLAIEDESGNIYPVLGKPGDRRVFIPNSGDVPYVRDWAESSDDYTDPLEYARESSREWICTWCYQTYRRPS